jgi:hypothetical protein
MSTQSNRSLFYEGRDLWQEYININDYSFEPTEKGLTKLSKALDLKKSYLRERISAFLSA